MNLNYHKLQQNYIINIYKKIKEVKYGSAQNI